MIARFRKIFIKSCLFLAAFNSVFAQDTPTDPGSEFYKEPGHYENRDYVNQHQSEHIDPFTGRLQLHYTDLHIPGNGGFDLNVVRSYTNIDDVGSTNNPFGEGWSIHFGKIFRTKSAAVTNMCATNFVSTKDMPVIELPDGSRQALARDDKYFIGGQNFISSGFWRATCPANFPGIVVYSPEGIRYEFTKPGSAPRGQQMLLTTKISDPEGNTINIEYTNLPVIGTVVPSKVSASDGRVINFSYTGSGSDARLYQIKSDTQTWTTTIKKLLIVGF